MTTYTPGVCWTEILSQHPSYPFITKKTGTCILSPAQDNFFYMRKYTPLPVHLAFWFAQAVFFAIYVLAVVESWWYLITFPLLLVPGLGFLLTKKYTSDGEDRHDFMLSNGEPSVDIVREEDDEGRVIVRYAIRDQDLYSRLPRTVEDNPELFALIGEYGRVLYRRDIVESTGGQYGIVQELDEEIRAIKERILSLA